MTTVLSEAKVHGGKYQKICHESAVLGCSMNVSVYVPELNSKRLCPALIFLSGLTCNEVLLANNKG